LKTYIKNSYSNLKASIGLNCDALQAGVIPKTKPIIKETEKLKIIEVEEIATGKVSHQK
jgi:hypothetical protein